MVRGSAASVGFSVSVSGWLRIYIAQRELKGGLTLREKHRLHRLAGVASLPGALGDDDPRIRLLALACPGSRWEPGPNQVAVIDGAGHDDGNLSPELFLAALCHAAALDLAAGHHRELAKVRKGAEVPATHEVILRFERERADQAERALRQAQTERETMRIDYLAEKAKRRELQTVLREGFPLPNGDSVHATPADPQPERRDATPEKLPTGIRRRGDRYEGLVFRRESLDGKQHGVGTFSTPEEAIAARQQALASAANAGGFDTTTGEQAEAIEALGRAS